MLRLLSNFAIIFSISLSVSAANYYVKNGGDDNADGLSDANAWETYGKAAGATLAGGHTVTFNRGDTFDIIHNSYWTIDDSGTADSYITIGAYGEGNLPVFNAIETVSGAWSDEGGNVWSKSMGGDLRRCWLDGIESPRAPTDQNDIEGSKWLWYRGGNVLYVYATENPDTAYSTVKISRISYGLLIKNASYIVVENIQIDGGKYNLAMEGNCSNIIIRNNKIYKSGNHGIYGHPGVDEIIHHVIVSNNIVDGQLSLATTTGYTSEEAYQVNADGIIMNKACCNWLVKDNVVRDFNHSCIGIDATNDLSHGCRDNIIEDNEMYNGTSVYNRGFGVGGLEDLGTKNIVRRNLISGMTMRSQLNGNENEVSNNLFVDSVNSPVVGRTNHSEGLILQGWSTETHPNNICKNNKVYNNTFSGIANQGIGIWSNDNAEVSGNEIKNNIIIDAGKSGAYMTNIAIWVEDSVIWDNTIENNLFYDADTDYVVNYKGTIYTVAEADSAISDFTGNMSSDPLLDGMALTSSSPAIDAGETLTEVVYDYRLLGRPQGAGYDIGAMEYGGAVKLEGVTLEGVTIE